MYLEKVLVFGSVSVALIVGYMVVKKMMKKAEEKKTKDPAEKSCVDAGGKFENGVCTSDKKINQCKSYMVNTKSKGLNYRDKPNGNVIGSLPKGTMIEAKDSGTVGWLELCPKGGGFVSSTYMALES